MNWRAILLTIVPLPGLFTVSGCGGNDLPTEANPEKSQEALKTSLESWKNGEKPESLKRLPTPIYFTDLDQGKGIRLLDYKIESEAKRFGQSMRYTVRLSLQQQQGSKVQKQRTYNIETDPFIVIVPADF